MAEGELDPDPFRPGALDVLAQHVMACACARPFAQGEMLDEVRSATPYSALPDDTFDRVLGFIRDSGEEPRVVEYLKTPPSREELAGLIARMGIAPRALLRRKGTPYDELGLDDPALADDALINAMVAHPILIERPIVVTPLGAKLCRPPEAVLDILPAPRRGASAG